MTTIAERYQDILRRVRQAMKRSPFGQSQVMIMGASKAQSLNKIREASELGVTDMGENYAQELLTKAPLTLDTNIRWHFIGRLQSNKIKHLVPYASSIGSVDSLELAERIGRVVESLEVPRASMPILLQVNQGSERQKSGLPMPIIENLFGRFNQIKGIQVVGLMTIPPQAKDPSKAREYFKEMKEFFEKLKVQHPDPSVFRFLSMGMSSDFEMAIEEGSNMIRVGEALFGPRPQREADQ
jgi:pyridoxal phosphate enzyme (YggS family)